MARTINDIQQSIITDLQTYFPKLSTSKVAEWRLWTYVVAAAIHAFEIILDLFRQEVDELTAKITPGTKLWYAEMCYRFQNGHTLVFDKNTAQFYYEQDDPDSRIVKVVAVNEVYKMISIRVAKTDGEGRIIPLDDSERRNLADYIDTIHTTGIPTTIVSTTADTIRYNLEVYYDPAVPSSVVREQVGQALEGVILALHRNENTVAGTQAVQGEQVQTGRTIDKDEVIVLLHLGQRLAQAALTSGQVDHFQTGTGQTGVGADDIGAVLGVPDGLRRRCPADEHLVSARFHAALWDAIAGGGVALRVEVYDEHFFAQRRHAGREVDGCGGLAHTALLVCNSNDFCHATCFLPGKRFVPHGTFRGRSPPFSPQQVPYTA